MTPGGVICRAPSGFLQTTQEPAEAEIDTTSNHRPTTFAFEVGQTFTRGSASFRLVEDRGAVFVLEHYESLERKIESLACLHREYLAGRLLPGLRPGSDQQPLSPFVAAETVVLDGLPLELATDAQRRHVTTVLTYIRELRSLGYRCLRPRPTLKIDFERIRTKHPELAALSAATVYQWSLELDRADGDVRAILPNFSARGGRGQARTSETFEAALRTVLDRVTSDKSSKIKASDVEKDVKQILMGDIGPDRALAEMGSRATISRRIRSEFSPYQLMKRNVGPKAADEAYRRWYPGVSASSPLEVVEFDDKDSGIFLIDEKSGLPFGRGFVTAGVDEATGVPVGLSISESPRNTWSAVNAFVNAILPKDPASPDFELVKSEVPYFGKIAVTVFDNALYNHAKALEAQLADCHALPAWAKPFTPTEKRAVEGFNGRMQAEFFSKYVGYAGPKDTTEYLESGMRAANASVEKLRKDLNKWIYDEYVHRPGPDGFTRAQRWHQGMRHFRPRLPVDIHRLRIVAALRTKVRLRPEGIRFSKNLIYQNDYVIKLKKALGLTEQVEIRFNPEDLSFVYLFDPLAKRLLIVPSASPEHTRGLTLFQHRLMLKMAAQRGHKNPSIPQMLSERESLRSLVHQLRHSKKRCERRLAVKTGEVRAPVDRPSAPTSPAPQHITDLEAQVNDIDQVELEPLGEGWDLPETV